MTEPFELLRSPIAIGPMELRNRVMMTAHSPRLPQRRYLRYLEERVRQGVALVTLPAMFGLYDLAFGPGDSFLDSARDEDGIAPHPLSIEGIAHYGAAVAVMRAQAEVVHHYGARCVGQLYHPGAARHIDATHDGFQPATSVGDRIDEFRRNVPHVLTEEGIATVVAAFGSAARRAAEAGMDGVELHGAHGYLIAEFLSPYSNHRTDAYGGSPENRLRFLHEVMAAVRAEIGPDLPIGLRLNGSDPAPGGLSAVDTAAIAAQAQAAGVAYISVSGGTFGGLRHGAAGYAYVAPSYAPPSTNVPDAAVIRQAVDIPVVVAGRIADLQTAEQILAAGTADLIGLTRALIADPSIISRSFRGEAEQVTPCIACNECHYGRPLSCAVNPAAGREDEMAIRRTDRSRTVLVIGGGPAGMECARIAAQRGHRVAIWEREQSLGGMLAVLGNDPPRAGFAHYADHLARSVAELGIVVELGREATVAQVVALGPEVVILATGGEDRRPAVQGARAPHVTTAADLYRRGPTHLGEHVTVIGGLDDHLGPLTSADLLARSGRRVTLLCEPFHAGQRLEAGTLHLLTARLLAQGVEFRPLTALAEIGDGWIEVRNVLTNSRSRLTGIDSIVLAGPRAPAHALAQPLLEAGLSVTLIGDCLAPRRIVHATMDGARAALAL